VDRLQDPDVADQRVGDPHSHARMLCFAIALGRIFLGMKFFRTSRGCSHRKIRLFVKSYLKFSAINGVLCDVTYL